MKSLQSLSLSYSRIGDYLKSLELDKKVYENRLKILGEDHLDTLESL